MRIGQGICLIEDSNFFPNGGKFVIVPLLPCTVGAQTKANIPFRIFEWKMQQKGRMWGKMCVISAIRVSFGREYCHESLTVAQMALINQRSNTMVTFDQKRMPARAVLHIFTIPFICSVAAPFFISIFPDFN